MSTERIGMKAMYDQATGDLWIAWKGQHFPTKAIHFDSSIDAEKYCEVCGLELSILEPPAGFGGFVSDKMRGLTE